MTPIQTFEDRIVPVVNTSVDATASKIICVTNGNLLRYKSDTNANIEKVEGFFAWRLFSSGSMLGASHPYYSVAPTF